MKLYHATPAENAQRIKKEGLKAVNELGFNTLAGRKKPFVTRTSKGNYRDIKDMVPFAFSTENRALKRVPRSVVCEYEFNPDTDEHVFSEGVSSYSYFHPGIRPEKMNEKKSELLIYNPDASRIRIPSGNGSAFVCALLPVYVNVPEMNHRLGRTFKTVWSFFRTDFEIGIHGKKGVSSYIFDGDRSLAFMCARNANGSHIYLRPQQTFEPYFVMLDDLNEEKLEAVMSSEKSYLAVRTSSENFQAWIRYSEVKMISEKLEIIEKYGADKKAHPNRRWGRAPGFLNRKSKHKDSDGRFQWVSVVRCVYG